MDRLFDDLIFRLTKNPLVTAEAMSEVALTSADTHFIANAAAIRAFLRKIVEGKKSGCDSAESDVLKLMLEDENY